MAVTQKTKTPRRAPAGSAARTKKERAKARKAGKPGGGARPRRGGRTGPLTREDRTYLRGLGHLLDPVIQVGHKGVTDALVAEAKSALRAHELIKVKLGRHAPEETSTVADAIAGMTGAEVVQVIGGVALLYAEPADPTDRKINIPGR